MDSPQRHRRQVFDEKVPVGNRIHRIAAELPEPKGFSGHISVQFQGAPGQSPRTQGQHVCAPGRIPQSPLVPFQHLDVSQQMMGQQHRLAALEVRVSGQNHFPVLLAEPHQGFLQGGDPGHVSQNRLPDPEAQVRGHLIVPTPPGVEFGTRRNPRRQGRLDVHVHILKRLPPPKLALGNFLFDSVQPLPDRGRLFFGKNSRFH